jgi:hypothetical protein
MIGCVNFRATRVSWSHGSLGPGVRGCYHPHQWGKLLPLDAAALCEREVLVATRLQSEKGPNLVEEVAEARGRSKGFEPTCRSVALLDAPMILLQMMIQVAVRSVHYAVPEDVANGTRVGIMAIRGDMVRVTPVTLQAERKNVSAAVRSCVALSRTSTR